MRDMIYLKIGFCRGDLLNFFISEIKTFEKTKTSGKTSDFSIVKRQIKRQIFQGVNVRSHFENEFDELIRRTNFD